MTTVATTLPERKMPKMERCMKMLEIAQKDEIGFTSFCLYMLARTLLFPGDRKGIANLTIRVGQIRVLSSLGNKTWTG